MSRHLGRVAGRLAEWLLLGVVLAALAYAGWFRLSGGHWERVETPSMGTTAPVGTLVWVRPVAPDDLRVGDVVSFRPPDRGGEVFTHRIAAVHADGTLSTAGDLSGPDQWRVPASDVVGRARWIWPGAGWLVRAAPVLLAGAVLTWGLVLLRRRERVPLAMVGAAITVAVAIVVYRPLTAAEQLGVETVPGGARATYVGTGLLPVRLTAAGQGQVELAAGHTGSITTAGRPGATAVAMAADLPPWFWLLVVGVCFAPAVASTARGGRRSALRP